MASVNVAFGSMAIAIYPFEFTSSTATGKQVSFLVIALHVACNCICNVNLVLCRICNDLGVVRIFFSSG